MNLALFDFDGTITSKETFPEFIRFSIPSKRLMMGRLVLAPLILGYKLGMVPTKKLRAAIVMFGFRNTPESHAKQSGVAFSRQFLPDLIRPVAMERIQWHQGQGDMVVVVSAGLDLYLSSWCEQLKLKLICSSLESIDGVLTGGYRGRDCCGVEKAKRILADYDLDLFETIYAYGDTDEDRAMLDLADKKYFLWKEVT